MFSPSHQKSRRLPHRRLNRRDLLVGGAALALSGAYPAPAETLARQGHSPLKTEAAESGVPNLRSLLRMVPANFIDVVESNGIDWQYADLDRQFASLGLHHDINGVDFENEPYLYGTYSLALASSVYMFALSDEVLTAIGFQPFGMDQTMVVGAPGRQLTLFRGGFDPDRLIYAWDEAGYEPYDTASGIPAWTIGLAGEFGPNHPIQGKLISAFNNVAIIGDVLVYSPYMELLEMALSFVDSGGASMADDPVFGPLIQSLPHTTVSAIAATSEQLLPDPVIASEEQLEEFESQLAQSDDRLGPMPAITGLVTAVNEGSTLVDFEWRPEGTPVAEPTADAGTSFVRMCTQSEEDAVQAATVAAGRWESLDSLVIKVPYLDLAEVVSHGAEGNVAMIDFIQLRSPGLWHELIMMSDVAPFAPS
jgi:hypothetical protein